METIVLVIHLILAIALVGVVLLQRSEGGGLGIGGGGSGGGLMSVRGTANLLTRATGILAAAFMATSLILAIMAGNQTERRSILDQPAGTAAPVQQQAPTEPSVPLSR